MSNLIKKLLYRSNHRGHIKEQIPLPNMIERCKSHPELKREWETPKATGQQPYGHQPKCPIKQQQLKSSKRRNPSPTGNREGVPRDPTNPPLKGGNGTQVMLNH